MATFVLTEEQQSIRKTARDFARERMPVAHLRSLRDGADDTGFSRALWKELADLGLASIVIPEDYGGAGLGWAELGLVLEELGRTLAPTPLVSTVVLGASALLLGGSDEQRQAHLPAIAAGDRILALAVDEGTRHAPASIATTATRNAETVRITGDKVMVLDGHVADAFVVAAREGGEIALYVVPADAAGVAVTRTSMVDSRNAARVRFDDVQVSTADRCGNGAVLDAVLDRGCAALAAEMLGGIQQAFDTTIDYLKTRKQFGVPIGSFQALKHRAAWMFCDVELTKSIVMYALRALDDDKSDAAVYASAAKARASDTFIHVASEAIQMHGGIGVTDEHDIGLYYKRARVCELSLGDAAYHRNRFAQLQGY